MREDNRAQLWQFVRLVNKAQRNTRSLGVTIQPSDKHSQLSIYHKTHFSKLDKTSKQQQQKKIEGILNQLGNRMIRAKCPKYLLEAVLPKLS